MVSSTVPQMYIDRCNEMTNIISHIWSQPMYVFEDLLPSKLEKSGAVYIIGMRSNDDILYVGRTKDLRRRLYTNHLMGNESTARLKKYLTKDELLRQFVNDMNVVYPDIYDPEQKKEAYMYAKNFIRQQCYFKFLKLDESRIRGLIEAGLAYALNTRFVKEEH